MDYTIYFGFGITTQFTEQTDMVIKQLHDYGFDYAYTLRDWRTAFMEQRDEIEALGYDEAFIRLWNFYFCYCEGGFLERTIGVVQVTAVKPNNIDTLHFSDEFFGNADNAVTTSV